MEYKINEKVKYLNNMLCEIDKLYQTLLDLQLVNQKKIKLQQLHQDVFLLIFMKIEKKQKRKLVGLCVQDLMELFQL